jgi:hypothetical protein
MAGKDTLNEFLGKRGLQEFLVVDHAVNLRKNTEVSPIDASMMIVWPDTDAVSIARTGQQS